MAAPKIIEVAHRLGARVRRVAASEFAGACPRCGGRDRFAVNTQREVWNCRGCGVGGDAIQLARHVLGMTFAQACAFVGDELVTDEAPRRAREGRQQAPTVELAESNRDRAIALWRRRLPVAGTLAETYLRRTRGYRSVIPATLGFLPSRAGYPPAMIAAYGLATEPEPGTLAMREDAVRALHLTRLRADATRMDKITLGRGLKGAPIVVAPPNDLLGLAITEGIEDALSVHEATGLGAWAAGAAGFMSELAGTAPGYIEHVTIIADDNDVGQRGAFGLAAGLDRRGIEHSIKTLRRERGSA
jgi:hypothetical protein